MFYILKKTNNPTPKNVNQRKKFKRLNMIFAQVSSYFRLFSETQYELKLEILNLRELIPSTTVFL